MGTYYDALSVIVARFGLLRNKGLKISALRGGIELGINLIDTAEIYGTEGLVAEAIRGFERDDLFIATKVWPSHLRYEALLKAAEGSIKRLQCSYIDLYQIHWPNPKVPIEETMRAMSKLVDEGGKLLTFGALTGNETQISIFSIYDNHLSILGSTGGTRKEMVEIIENCSKLKVKVWKKFKLDDVKTAIGSLFSKERDGRVLLEIDHQKLG